MQYFFRRALEVEEGAQSSTQIRIKVEGENGVFVFEQETAVGVLMSGDMTTINTTLIKRIIPDFKGFALAVVPVKAVSDLSIKCSRIPLMRTDKCPYKCRPG